MKFIHVADLHIGKIVNDFSMLEDQQFILTQIAGMAKENSADMVIIAGDVYDRAIPPAEAVTLFDSFLNELSEAGIQTVIISGNHDSPERLSFGESLLGKQGVHIAGIRRKGLSRVTFQEKEQETEFVLLPFLKPAQVGVRTSSEAVESILKEYWDKEREKASEHRKNRVLVTHFFVTNGGREPELSDSETTIHVGGLDNVDVSVFQGFDYVALGHIHKPQQIGDYPVWYAGSPLQYSFGEAGMTKAALLVTMDGEGLKAVEKLSLRPRREMRKIKGTLKELLEDLPEKEQDYIQAILTDQGELIDPIGTIRSRYPNVMQIVREEKEHVLSEDKIVQDGTLMKKKDTLAMFEDFYQEVRQEELTKEGRSVIADVIRELEGSTEMR